MKIKNILKYPIIFILIVILLLSIFIITVKFISKEKIEENIKSSMQYLESKTEIKEIKPRRDYSYLHVYADEILLNMIYCMDENKSFESVMIANYYQKDFFEIKIPSLEGAIENNGQGNQEYIRYWHGSMIIIRPLLLFFNIQQIYYIMAFIMILLILILIGILIKKKQILLIITTIIGYIMVAINYVPFCLEYVWTFIIMLIVSIIALKIKKHNILFFISGIMTCFLDFLSTEIITFFVPILYVYTIKYTNGEVKDIKKEIKQILLWIILWAIGYVAMWFSKWILASIVLNINAFDYVIDKAMIRVNGQVLDYSIQYIIFTGILRNIKTIYPFFLYKNLPTIICTLIGIISITALTIKKDKKSIINLLIYLTIAIMPYIRYAILANHSFRHCFFTFREQLITIMALIIGIYISIDKERLKSEIRRPK